MNHSKRLHTFLLIAALLFVWIVPHMTVASAAEKAYPDVRIDPATGRPYDLGGKTVYIYNYWGSSSDVDTATQKYRQWIQTTYNCKIKEEQRGDWGTCAHELADFVQNPDQQYCIFTIEPGKMGLIIQNDLAANWKKSNSISLSKSKWNKSTIKYMSYNGGIYGVSTGKSEPRQCLFFNKRVLEEAGINWNSIYAMQKNGSWTWDKFTSLMDKIHRDTDNDGAVDIYGLTGSADDFYRISVFSNGGSFFDYSSSGELVSTVGSANSREALTWAKKVWNKYAAKTPEGANWDWYKAYKEFWKTGTSGFYIYQTYGGFNQYSEMSDMADQWGCVAFPKGPNGKGYVTIVSNNITVLPKCLSDDAINKTTLIYDLWTDPTPDVPVDEYSQYEGLTDSSAIYETYAMLSESGHGAIDLTQLLGTVNDILGSSLLWKLSSEDLDELIASAQAGWKDYLETINQYIHGSSEGDDEQETSITTDSGLKFNLDYSSKTATVTGIVDKNIKSIKIPDTVKNSDGKKFKVTVIGKAAFKGCKKMTTATLGKNLTTIESNAFNGCKKLEKITIKAKKITSVGKGAYKNISKKAVFKCPSEKLATTYKDLFIKDGGAPKTATFK